MSQKYDKYLENHRQAVKKAYQWIAAMFAWYKDHEAYIKLHNNTRSIVEEILEMIRTKLTEVENAEN